MTALWAVAVDTWRHLWRAKAPVAILAGVLLMLLGLPFIVVSDGTLEGKCRVFLLYAVRFQVVLFCLLAAGLAVWLERKERSRQVHLRLALAATGRLGLLGAKAASLLAIVLLFAALSSLAIAAGLTLVLFRQASSPAELARVRERLWTVHEMRPLRTVSDLRLEPVRLRGLQERAGVLQPGSPVRFLLEVPRGAAGLRLQGTLFSAGSGDATMLGLALVQDGKVFWSRVLPVESAKPFVQLLPHDLDPAKSTELEVVQGGPEGKVFYYKPSEPFAVSSPRGGFWSNLPGAWLLFAMLCAFLMGLAFACSQFVTAQVSLLLTATMAGIGFLKGGIQELLFPVPLAIEGVPTPPPTAIDLLYLVLWKPVLFLLPDFQALDPSTRMVEGRWISWPEVLEAFGSVAPCAALVILALHWALPRQEAAELRP